MRNEATKTTIYEIKIPSTVFRGEHLLTSGQATTTSAGQVNYLHAGMQFGVAVCVNDGDNDAGETGQQGWSGWGPYALVYGKNAAQAGLITLGAAPPAACADPARCDESDRPKPKNRRSCPATASCPWFSNDDGTGHNAWFYVFIVLLLAAIVGGLWVAKEKGLLPAWVKLPAKGTKVGDAVRIFIFVACVPLFAACSAVMEIRAVVLAFWPFLFCLPWRLHWQGMSMDTAKPNAGDSIYGAPDSL